MYGESDNRLLVEKDNEYRVAAIGKVIVLMKTEIMVNHRPPMLNGHSSVIIVDDLELDAFIPCRTNESTCL